ncbi:MAG: hypothetical protein GTO53_07145 [Planctomycetales bacterium]|nr:hypothetical protein [Planctomycetales bacterium]NIM08912.1 hypothetical protein [Planctomycetales bacterium]NIN09568.1 hypothetical protein [Planctomycetales bacterium]NIN78680.1 hypothetical protein [Planctomycetales bacterium]NIO35869.1 hypothetical protein [Planctomycetales bacterium]
MSQLLPPQRYHFTALQSHAARESIFLFRKLSRRPAAPISLLALTLSGFVRFLAVEHHPQRTDIGPQRAAMSIRELLFASYLRRAIQAAGRVLSRRSAFTSTHA